MRNHLIMRLRGALPLLKIIPNDVLKVLNSSEKIALYQTRTSLLKALDKVKKIMFICKDCTNHGHYKKTKSKRATRCDRCGAFGVDLYINKDRNNDL